VSLLKKDHEDVKKLFKEIEAEEEPKAIFKQIKGALEVHAAIEEEIFYPAVKKLGQRKSKTRSGKPTKNISRSKHSSQISPRFLPTTNPTRPKSKC